MQLPDNPALYVAIALFVLIALAATRSPALRRLLSLTFWLGSIAVMTVLFTEQGRFHPNIAAVLQRLNLDPQEVVGEEVRIRMSPDGHFWVRAVIGGQERRMLVDSGATVTALSSETATSAGVQIREGLTPVVMQTANGATLAQAATLDRLTIGGIEARDLAIVVSPSLGRVDILGMNFLSQLASWRVEGRTMTLVPKPAAP